MGGGQKKFLLASLAEFPHFQNHGAAPEGEAGGGRESWTQDCDSNQSLSGSSFPVVAISI